MVQSTNVWLALLNRTTFAFSFAVLFIKMPCTSNVLYSVKVALHFHRMLYKYQLRMRKNVPQLRLHSSLTDNQIQYYVNRLLFSTCKCSTVCIILHTSLFPTLVLSHCNPNIITSCVHVQQGVKQSHCLPVCLSMDKNIETAEIHSYSLRKGYYKTFELFFEGYSPYSVIYNLWEPHIQSFEFSYYSSPTPPL